MNLYSHGEGINGCLHILLDTIKFHEVLFADPEADELAHDAFSALKTCCDHLLEVKKGRYNILNQLDCVCIHYTVLDQVTNGPNLTHTPNRQPLAFVVGFNILVCALGEQESISNEVLLGVINMVS